MWLHFWWIWVYWVDVLQLWTSPDPGCIHRLFHTNWWHNCSSVIEFLQVWLDMNPKPVLTTSLGSFEVHALWCCEVGFPWRSCMISYTPTRTHAHIGGSTKITEITVSLVISMGACIVMYYPWPQHNIILLFGWRPRTMSYFGSPSRTDRI